MEKMAEPGSPNKQYRVRLLPQGPPGMPAKDVGRGLPKAGNPTGSQQIGKMPTCVVENILYKCACLLCCVRPSRESASLCRETEASVPAPQSLAKHCASAARNLL